MNSNQEHLANNTRMTPNFTQTLLWSKANKLTEENPAKQNFDLETPSAVRPPLAGG
jgi:hypothetical protein